MKSSLDPVTNNNESSIQSDKTNWHTNGLADSAYEKIKIGIQLSSSHFPIIFLYLLIFPSCRTFVASSIGPVIVPQAIKFVQFNWGSRLLCRWIFATMQRWALACRRIFFFSKPPEESEAPFFLNIFIKSFCVDSSANPGSCRGVFPPNQISSCAKASSDCTSWIWAESVRRNCQSGALTATRDLFYLLVPLLE